MPMFPMPRDDFGSQDTEAAQAERAAQEPVSPVEALGAMAGQTTGDVWRFAKHKLQPEPFFQGDLKSPKELNEQYDLKGSNAFTNWTNGETAAEMVAALKKRQQAEEVLTRFSNSHGWLTRNAVGMIGSMLDPVEASAMLVPGVGEERIAYKLAEMGFGRQAAIVAGKMGAGATGAMAGTAALEPLRAIMSEDELRDWSVRDAMTNVFYAAPIGALLHAGVSPAISAGFAKATGRDVAPYFHDYYQRPQLEAGMPEPRDLTQEGLRAAVTRGVAEGSYDPNRAPTIGNTSFGHVQELMNLTAPQRHLQQTVSTAQILSGREVDNTPLFPDHTEQARRLAPEAHEEWDRLHAEHNALAAEHVWGARPTPEQLNDPAWMLEQELRDHVRDILPVSWDLRVAAGELPGAGEGAMAHLAETPAEHTPAPGKKDQLSEIGSEPSPAFKVVDDRGNSHDFTVNEVPNKHGKAVEFNADNAKVKLEQRPDGRWEVAWMTVEKHARGGGLMGKVYDAIEREYGNQMIPSGLLRESGYNFWKNRNPDLVRYHQQVEGYGKDYHSPRFIKEQIEEYEAELAQARAAKDRPAIASIQSDLKPWREAWNRVPEAGKTPQAIEAMYSFGGKEAAFPPPGREEAEAMEARGESPEVIWEKTGWHKGATGHWLFEIDDSKAVLDEQALGDMSRPYKGVLAGILDHEELYTQFPQLRGVDVELAVGDKWQQGGKAIYKGKELKKLLVAEPTVAMAKKTLIHEIRHFVQVIQGEPMKQGVEIPVWNKIIDEVKKSLPPEVVKEHGNQIDADIRYAIYHHSVHEMEARIAEARTEMTPEERRETPPFVTKDILSVFPENQKLTGDMLERYNLVHDIVQRVLGREPFDIEAYRAKRQAATAAADKARGKADEAKRAANEREAAAKAERDRAAKARADAEEAARKAEEARQAKLTAEREAAEAHAQRTETEAAKAEAELAKLKDEHARAVEDDARRKQAQADAEKVLAKAEADLADAKQKAKDAESAFKDAKAEENIISRQLSKIESFVKEFEMLRQDRAYLNERRRAIISDIDDAIKVIDARQKEVDARQKEIDKARADEETARKAADEAQKKADAIRYAEDVATRTEAKAAKAQKDLDVLLAQIERQNARAETAAQNAAKAEERLSKTEEGLAKAKDDHDAAQRKYDEVQKEFDKIRSDYEAVRKAAERHEVERLDQVREESPLIVAQGMSDPARRTVWISAMAVDPKLVAREESGHAIRASGLFKPQEWGILRDAAINRGWIEDMPKAVQERYREVYADRGPDGVRDAMVEEAIMHRFAKGPEVWGEAGGPVARLMQRIKELLERIGNWMTSRGFQSANDVFRAMEEGKISGRDTMAPHAARRSGEIEARMKELEPQILNAYNEAKANYQPDIPSIAEAQRSLWREGFAPAMDRPALQQAIQQIYGPKEEVKFTPAKPGETPIELQIMEQQHQKMIAEGYRPLTDEIAELAETERGVQQALMTEQGYAQAGECLMMAAI